jgi:hypothetical protein
MLDVSSIWSNHTALSCFFLTALSSSKCQYDLFYSGVSCETPCFFHHKIWMCLLFEATILLFPIFSLTGLSIYKCQVDLFYSGACCETRCFFITNAGCVFYLKQPYCSFLYFSQLVYVAPSVNLTCFTLVFAVNHLVFSSQILDVSSIWSNHTALSYIFPNWFM